MLRRVSRMRVIVLRRKNVIIMRALGGMSFFTLTKPPANHPLHYFSDGIFRVVVCDDFAFSRVQNKILNFK